MPCHKLRCRKVSHFVQIAFVLSKSLLDASYISTYSPFTLNHKTLLYKFSHGLYLALLFNIFKMILYSRGN